MIQRDENIKHKSTSIERKPIIHQTKKIEGNPLMNARHKHSTQSKTGMKYPMFGTQPEYHHHQSGNVKQGQICDNQLKMLDNNKGIAPIKVVHHDKGQTIRTHDPNECLIHSHIRAQWDLWFMTIAVYMQPMVVKYFLILKFTAYWSLILSSLCLALENLSDKANMTNWVTVILLKNICVYYFTFMNNFQDPCVKENGEGDQDLIKLVQRWAYSLHTNSCWQVKCLFSTLHKK